MIVQNDGLFADITSKVYNSCECVKIKRNEVIYLQENPVHYLYMVVKGEVCLTSVCVENTEMFIASAVAGDFFGETDLLLGTPASFTAITRINSVIRKVPEFTFKALLNMPEINAKMMTYLARQNKTHIEHLTIVGCYSKNRAEIGLDWLAKNVGVQTDKGTRINLTMQQIGGAIGYARETMSRSVSKLIRQHKVYKDQSKNCYLFVRPDLMETKLRKRA